MTIDMPVVWSERHGGHAPGYGIWLGTEIAADEEPVRGTVLRDALVDSGAMVVAPTEHGDEPVFAVHSPDMVDLLASAYDRWIAEGHLDDPGRDRVVPYVFALSAVTGGRQCRRPATVRADIGRFAMDTMTVIGPGTYDAARAAIDCALTACDRVLDGATRAAYAAVRPPGHHAGGTFFGGSCYLNNAACAAQYLRDRGCNRVAVIDIDAHHGNGTQEVFYDRADVWFGSVHVDPGAGWFPHYVGFADETGSADGLGANHNRPLPEGSDDPAWVEAITWLADAAREWAPDAVVVSLGVDAVAEDENSPLRVTDVGFAEAGRLLATIECPTVFVQEGGYVLATLGAHVVSVLTAFERA